MRKLRSFCHLLPVIFGSFICGCYIFTHMEPDTVVPAEVAADTEVMASVEEGPVDRFILADISQDDAFMTLPLEDAASLPAWR
jgi:hypothetical protein